jgi:hypothetical protein
MQKMTELGDLVFYIYGEQAKAWEDRGEDAGSPQRTLEALLNRWPLRRKAGALSPLERSWLYDLETLMVKAVLVRPFTPSPA